MAMVAGLALAACSSSPDESQPALKLVQTPVEVPESARLSCTSMLSGLPDDGGLSERQVVDKWGNDRMAVKICDRRRAGAVAAIDAANATLKNVDERQYEP
ncbi:hypothetical protein [Martelella limonii]|uniref:hypothetical protein n=1 Tax=Martelella limonii TaxID=1647649 RepID=UPI0015803F90|nr:hypothetical protein [Martelella limonii]